MVFGGDIAGSCRSMRSPKDINGQFEGTHWLRYFLRQVSGLLIFVRCFCQWEFYSSHIYIYMHKSLQSQVIELTNHT